MISFGKDPGWYENNEGRLQYWDGEKWGPYPPEDNKENNTLSDPPQITTTEEEQIADFVSEGAPEFNDTDSSTPAATSPNNEEFPPPSLETVYSYELPAEPEYKEDSTLPLTPQINEFEQIGFVGDEPVYKKLNNSEYPQVEVTKNSKNSEKDESVKIIMIILLVFAALILAPLFFTLLAGLISGIGAVFASFFQIFGYAFSLGPF